MAPRRARRAAALMVATAAWAIAASTAMAATPDPSQAGIGDARSAGQGPGFVGDPLLAITIVVLIAVASLAITLAWVRATGGPHTPDAGSTEAG